MTMHPMFALSHLTLTALLALTTTGCLTITGQATTLHPVERIVIRADSGEVQVRVDDVAHPHITYDVSAWSSRPPQVDVNRRGETLHARYLCPERIGVCRVDWSITLPRESTIAVDVATDSGDITIEGTRGDVTIATDSGEVSAMHLQGAVAAVTTDSGNIQLGFVTPPPRVKAQSDSGDITVYVPDDKESPQSVLNLVSESGDVALERVR